MGGAGGIDGELAFLGLLASCHWLARYSRNASFLSVFFVQVRGGFMRGHELPPATVFTTVTAPVAAELEEVVQELVEHIF
jgi:hypothetical protein